MRRYSSDLSSRLTWNRARAGKPGHGSALTISTTSAHKIHRFASLEPKAGSRGGACAGVSAGSRDGAIAGARVVLLPSFRVLKAA